MLKYTTAEVTFREIPDEITLCINISNCPIHCPDCHSKELWGDIGEILYPDTLLRLIEENKGITCVCFLGGDSDPEEITKLTHLVQEVYEGDIKVAWYSGRSIFKIPLFFDYIKVGSYKKELGGLDSPITNQRLYKFYYEGSQLYFEDITYKFWRHDTNIS